MMRMRRGGEGGGGGLTFGEGARGVISYEAVTSPAVLFMISPQMVEWLRIASFTHRYEALSSRMEGAPEEAGEAEFWATTLVELKEAHGADQVDELLQ